MSSKTQFAIRPVAKTQQQQLGNAATGSVIALLILVILGMGGGGFYLQKQQEAENELLHQYIAKVETELGAKVGTVQEFKGSLAKMSKDIQSMDQILNDHLATLNEKLESVGKRVKAVELAANQDWMLSEIEYLMKMAEIRIAMKQDVTGAIMLLEHAEKLLKQMPADDSALLKVRVAITKDIASMEVFRAVDMPGTYAELVALGDMMEKLPLVPTTMAEAGGENEGGKQPKALSEINETLAGYITIRRHDADDLKMLLSPEQRVNLRDSIRLSLEQAQTALLRSNQSIYDDSLSEVRKWLLNYFVADNFRVKMAAKKIEKLLKVQVQNDLPSIAESRGELKRYIADRMRDQGL